MNACKATINMWNIDHAAPNKAPEIVPAILVAASIPMSMKITSPAYILPNKRNECDSGFEMYSIILNAKFAKNNSGLNNRPRAPPIFLGTLKLGEPKGEQKTS